MTFAFIAERRMAALYPLIFSSALMNAFYMSALVNILVGTMHDHSDWSITDKIGNALYVMTAFGMGANLGNVGFG